MKRPGKVVAMVLLGLVLASGARAAEVEGEKYEESAAVDGTKLVLSNVAVLRYRLYFVPIKPYVGGFYVAEGTDPKDWRKDVAKRLELAYFYSIAGKEFGPAGEEVLAKNVSAEAMKKLREELDAIGKLYQDVKPGDRYALTYVPEKGMTLAKNGKDLGTVPCDAAFAAAYYEIWLGKEPIDPSFRDAILAKR